MRGPARAHGFTLIELVIAVTIVGILLAIAVPSYLEQVRKANRTEAMEALSRAAVAQERFLFSHGRYSTSLGGPPTTDPATSGLGQHVSTREGASDPAYYDLDLVLAGGGYTLSATPRGATQSVDRCGVLTLSHTGVRAAARPDCW